MKKLLLSILVLAPAIWAGATWFTSQNTEEVLDEMLAQSNQQAFEALPFLKIEKTSFEKGFAQSSAQSVITIDPSFFGNSDDQLIQIGLNHAIYHGPVMITPSGIKTGSSYIVTTLDQSTLSEEIRVNITSFFGDAEPFVSGVTTGMSEMIDTDFSIAPFFINVPQNPESTIEGAGEERFNASFSGLSGNFTSNMQGTQIKGEMDSGEIKITFYDGEQNIEITMAASIIDVDADELYKGSLLDGKIVVTIPSVLYSNGNGTDIVFNDLSISSFAEQEQSLINADATFDINSVQITSPSIDYAIPDYKLHMNSSISGIERATVIKVVDLEQEVQASQMSFLSGEEPDIAGERFKASTFAYFRAIGELIKKNVNISSVVELSSETGDAAINLDLSYVDIKELAAHKTVQELANALQGKLAINIDKSILAGTPLEEAIGLPVMMGFAVEKEASYESIADLNEGELMLNGQPVPFLDAMRDDPLPWAENFTMQSE